MRLIDDAQKLRLLAAWFDMWDRPETDRQAILDDPRNPGRNDVQIDLRRIADTLDAAPTAPLDAARLRAIIEQRFLGQGYARSEAVLELLRSTIALAVDDILADLGVPMTDTVGGR